MSIECPPTSNIIRPREDEDKKPDGTHWIDFGDINGNPTPKADGRAAEREVIGGVIEANLLFPDMGAFERVESVFDGLKPTPAQTNELEKIFGEGEGLITNPLVYNNYEMLFQLISKSQPKRSLSKFPEYLCRGVKDVLHEKQKGLQNTEIMVNMYSALYTLLDLKRQTDAIIALTVGKKVYKLNIDMTLNSKKEPESLGDNFVQICSKDPFEKMTLLFTNRHGMNPMKCIQEVNEGLRNPNDKEFGDVIKYYSHIISANLMTVIQLNGGIRNG